MDILKRTALRLKLHKVTGTAVQYSVLLKKIIDKKGFLTECVKGFCIIPETREVCVHYWVRVDPGLDLDLAFELAKLRDPELKSLNPVLVEQLPPGLEVTAQDPENERQYLLYQEDPKAFWSQFGLSDF